MLKKNRYRPRRPSFTLSLKTRRRIASAVAFGLALVMAVVLYTQLFSKGTDTTPQLAEADVQERAQIPSPQPAPAEAQPQALPSETAESDGGEEAPSNEYTGVIESGATAGQMLSQWLSPQDTANLIEACKNVYGLHNLRAGQPYCIIADEDNGLQLLEYEIDNDQKLIVTGENGAYTAKIEKIHYDIVLKKVEGTIQSNLFSTMDELGESAALAVRLADIFAWEINFIRSVQPGDSFRLLVEKRYRDGEFKGYGKMPMAVFVNEGRVHDAFLFERAKGNTAYFNSEGESLKRAFLKAPLAFNRISSRFSPKRLHPILKTWRAHPAVDYAAPSGTPVKAIGRGQVVFAGWGKGAGNYIAIKHSSGYESMYLHLKGFAKGIKKGANVEQGQLIGYVGSTGYSTGPHLDFRMKKNGTYVNPEKLPSPKADPVTKAEIPQFKKNRDVWRAYMDGTKRPEEYAKDMAGTEETAAKDKMSDG